MGQFEKAAFNISGADGRNSPNSILQAIRSLGASAKDGNLQDAKQKYVSVVTALQSWVGASGVTGIKGL